MSHVADVQMQIKDLDALRSVVARMGGELVMGQKTHRWYGRFLNDWSSDRAAVRRIDSSTFGKCEHAIKFDGIDYEIGLITGEGGYQLIYDSYGGDLERKLGIGLPILKQAYGVEVTTRQLSRLGYRTTTTQNANGSVRVEAVRA